MGGPLVRLAALACLADRLRLGLFKSYRLAIPESELTFCHGIERVRCPAAFDHEQMLGGL